MVQGHTRQTYKTATRSLTCNPYDPYLDDFIFQGLAEEGRVFTEDGCDIVCDDSRRGWTYKWLDEEAKKKHYGPDV